MSIVKVKALSSFEDSSLGSIKSGGFYKVSREKADHYIENGLAEEIVVQTKPNTVTVTKTKPAPAKVAAPKKPTVVVNGKHSNASAGKGAASRNK